MIWLLLVLWFACGAVAWLWTIASQDEVELIDLIALPLMSAAGLACLLVVAIVKTPKIVVWRKK